ncbi:MAG: hypothetical protein QMD04_04100 [Anaerolineales bacterium]|nr:hypothetical protein [Anaerolineales bacterium]
MTTELLEWVNAYLEKDEDIVVAIKKMWNEWSAAHEEPSLEEFSAAVLADPRNEAGRGVDHREGMDWMSPEERAEYEREMEEKGFFSGPRVRLKSREITREHIARMIKKHNERMEWALKQAREVMPEDISEPQEGELIDLIEKVKEFRKELRKLGLEAEDEDKK